MYTVLIPLGRKAYTTPRIVKGKSQTGVHTSQNTSIPSQWSRLELSLAIGRCTELDSNVAVTE